MKILKFGGTSVGSPERMHAVARLVTKESEEKIVVLSAVSGTTNTLVGIGAALAGKQKDKALEIIQKLRQDYIIYVEGLLADRTAQKAGYDIIEAHFAALRNMASEPFTADVEKEILAQGELLSTKLFSVYLQEQGIKAALLPALDFMRIDEDNEPDMAYISEKLKMLLAENQQADIYVTQGYICLNSQNRIDNLQRGGSDYTASLIGAAIAASEIQIWTDIDGMHNNDPRIVKQTFPIAELSFDEAAELAYFGAKILHPSSIRPAQGANVPVRLLNTLKPEAAGTLISSQGPADRAITAVAAKDDITAIKIRSSRMLLAYGFLRKVFEIFEKYKTPIDLITTSEVAVSLTIDNPAHLQAILDELDDFGEVEVSTGFTIICVVGNMPFHKVGILKQVLDAVDDIPIRMTSYGGSRFNISLLVESKHKTEALTRLNEKVFGMIRK